MDVISEVESESSKEAYTLYERFLEAQQIRQEILAQLNAQDQLEVESYKTSLRAKHMEQCRQRCLRTKEPQSLQFDVSIREHKRRQCDALLAQYEQQSQAQVRRIEALQAELAQRMSERQPDVPAAKADTLHKDNPPKCHEELALILHSQSRTWIDDLIEYIKQHELFTDGKVRAILARLQSTQTLTLNDKVMLLQQLQPNKLLAAHPKPDVLPRITSNTLIQRQKLRSFVREQSTFYTNLKGNLTMERAHMKSFSVLNMR